ncbi:MAG: maltose/maltodextrin ABC transporter ATP-binding protein MalK, partial [Pontibacterium sp.]
DLPMATVTLKKICKSYYGIPVSKDINLSIEEGEFVVFVGPSGCGKSTLLRMIAGLEEITAGELFIGDQLVNDVPPADRSVGMVFQSYALYPHMSVAENMAFGLKLAKANKQETQSRVEQAAKSLQLEKLLERKPKDLSGGQRQRVAIGRTMVREPQVLLFDEPLSNLDAGLRVKMRIEIAKLHKRLSSTMIYVTHDQVEAMTLADKIVVLNEGKISQVGSPLTLYHYPDNQFVASFIGSPSMNFFDVTVESASDTHAEVRLPNNLTVQLPVNAQSLVAGDKATVGIRPEHLVETAKADATLSGSVNVVERLGDQTLVYMTLEGGSDAIARLAGDIAVDESLPFILGLDAKRCHLFTESGDACKRLHIE